MTDDLAVADGGLGDDATFHIVWHARIAGVVKCGRAERHARPDDGWARSVCGVRPSRMQCEVTASHGRRFHPRTLVRPGQASVASGPGRGDDLPESIEDPARGEKYPPERPSPGGASNHRAADGRPHPARSQTTRTRLPPPAFIHRNLNDHNRSLLTHIGVTRAR